MAVNVSLTPVEMHHAAMTGVLRQIEALRLRLRDRFGTDPADAWSIHIEGAAGEMAAAKALGLYWSSPVNTFKRGGDVGDLQIRTRREHHNELIVRPGDRDSDTFILVTGRSPHFRVHGYITGDKAKRECWLHTYGGRPPAYFVPQSVLQPVQMLQRSQPDLQAGAVERPAPMPAIAA